MRAATDSPSLRQFEQVLVKQRRSLAQKARYCERQAWAWRHKPIGSDGVPGSKYRQYRDRAREHWRQHEDLTKALKVIREYREYMYG